MQAVDIESDMYKHDGLSGMENTLSRVAQSTGDVGRGGIKRGVHL